MLGRRSGQWLSVSDPEDSGNGDTMTSTSPQIKQQQYVPGTRTMADSFTMAVLPFSKDKTLLEKYKNTAGGLRIGKLLENLDSLAGTIGYRHCLPATAFATSTEDGMTGITTGSIIKASHDAELYIATAAADRIDMFHNLAAPNEIQYVAFYSMGGGRDIRFSGFVTYTGSSSMEVFVRMEGLGTQPGDEPKTIMLGRFSIVCRDAITHRAKKCPQLVLNTPEEKAMFAIGEDHKNRKKTSSMIALDKVPPSQPEINMLHEMMLKVAEREKQIEDSGKIGHRPHHATIKEEIVYTSETELDTVTLVQPQERNLHGELAYVNATVFAGKPLRFLALDQIIFRLPVPIGAVVRMTAVTVTSTRPKSKEELSQGLEFTSAGNAKVHVVVEAQIQDVAKGVSTLDAREMRNLLTGGSGSQTRETTNRFFFSFAGENQEPLAKLVVPKTYQEAMAYIEGARRLEVGGALRRHYNSS
ncbi:hypothetical protein QFC22_003109 [Naganishia vaughanmartiniae]|uniref:Uncharacterized protein n=1 Tax=Naganishia vaughanmartiniae TaxID=1424756 RepID=A0ACC2XA30_9TREE|nr:hypothetical protein QFC22_003109 [Naganishia vaughanmartiniae]